MQEGSSVADWLGRRTLKSEDPEFKSHFDRQLDLFQVIPGSPTRVHL